MLLLLVYSIFNLCQKYPYFRNRLTIIKMYKMWYVKVNQLINNIGFQKGVGNIWTRNLGIYCSGSIVHLKMISEKTNQCLARPLSANSAPGNLQNPGLGGAGGGGGGGGGGGAAAAPASPGGGIGTAGAFAPGGAGGTGTAGTSGTPAGAGSSWMKASTGTISGSVKAMAAFFKARALQLANFLRVGGSFVTSLSIRVSLAIVGICVS